MSRANSWIDSTNCINVSKFLSSQTPLRHTIFLPTWRMGVKANGRDNFSSQLLPQFSQISKVSFNKHVDCCMLLMPPAITQPLNSAAFAHTTHRYPSLPLVAASSLSFLFSWCCSSYFEWWVLKTCWLLHTFDIPCHYVASQQRRVCSYDSQAWVSAFIWFYSEPSFLFSSKKQYFQVISERAPSKSHRLHTS